MTKQVVNRETAKNMFFDLLIANALLLGLVSSIAFAHGVLITSLFFLGLGYTALGMARYARKIFPKKRGADDVSGKRTGRDSRGK